MSKFVGSGTDGLFLVKDSGGNVYRSFNATNCKAVFTSASEFTFTCDNLEQDGGAGIISVSQGSFTRIDS